MKSQNEYYKVMKKLYKYWKSSEYSLIEGIKKTFLQIKFFEKFPIILLIYSKSSILIP